MMKVKEFDRRLWKPYSFLHKKFKRRFWRLFFAAIGPRYTLKQVEGLDMIVDLKDLQGVSKELLRQSEFETFACAQAKNWITPGSTVLDIGANIGFWSIHCARFTTGQVFAFEPAPSNIRLLEANVKLNRSHHVVVVPKACGEVQQKMKLYLSASNFGDHQLYSTGERRSAVEVEVCRVDDELKIPKNVSFIKIDVQGYEEFVLKGMMGTLSANPQAVILCEFWPEGMKRAGSDPRNFLKWMKSLGYEYVVIPHLQNRFVSREDMDEEKLLTLCDHGRYVDLVFRLRT